MQAEGHLLVLEHHPAAGHRQAEDLPLHPDSKESLRHEGGEAAAREESWE